MLFASLLMQASEFCPAYAGFFGSMGVAAAICFTVLGSAYGTAKSSVGISSMGVMKPEFMIKSTLPVVFAGIIGIYGLIVCVVVLQSMSAESYTLFRAMLHLGAGLAVGICGLASGMAIGIVGDCGVRASAQQPRTYVGMVVILIFSEALALYGLIVAILMTQYATGDDALTSICTAALQNATTT